MGLRRKAKPKAVIVFGDKGVVGIGYLGEFPYQHRGAYTGKLYVWNKHAMLWIDKRDVPGLVKAVGRDLLDGVPDKPKRERKSRTEKQEVEQLEREIGGEL